VCDKLLCLLNPVLIDWSACLLVDVVGRQGSGCEGSDLIVVVNSKLRMVVDVGVAVYSVLLTAW
jgi:hypothetical protein